MGSIKIKAPPSAEPSPHFTVSNKRSREAETATPPPASSAKKAKLSSEASILDEVDFPGAKSDHGFSRWTIAETLVLAQSISKIGVNDWPKVSEDCHEHLYRSNHHHPHKVLGKVMCLFVSKECIAPRTIQAPDQKHAARWKSRAGHARRSRREGRRGVPHELADRLLGGMFLSTFIRMSLRTGT